MPIYDLFSKRQKRLRGDVPEVFVYDEIPGPLRVQIADIIQDAIGDGVPGCCSERDYAALVKILRREYGVHRLEGSNILINEEPRVEFLNFILTVDSTEQVIDAVELAMRCIEISVPNRNHTYLYSTNMASDDAIEEINGRFRETAVGYEYVSGEIIRIDSKLIHAEVIKPALSLLANPEFAGANDEFMKAHAHYRHGRYKECLNECLKAFESTMKTICAQKGWSFSPNANASNLVEVCLGNDLFPSFLQSHIGSLRSILTSGVPTVRNKQSGHGQGPSVLDVDESMARFALNTTASNILLFVESM